MYVKFSSPQQNRYFHLCTRWFKYDRDLCGLFTHKSVPVIYEPHCILFLITLNFSIPTDDHPVPTFSFLLQHSVYDLLPQLKLMSQCNADVYHLINRDIISFFHKPYETNVFWTHQQFGIHCLFYNVSIPSFFCKTRQCVGWWNFEGPYILCLLNNIWLPVTLQCSWRSIS
jgi:hypothetical protein